MRVTFLFLLVLISMGCHKKEALPPKAIPQVEVAKAHMQDVQLYNTYVGHVEATVQVEVKAQVEGELTGYYFTEGDSVKEGNLIFTIDSRPFEAQLAKAEAALAQSIVSLRYAEDVVRRNRMLAKQDYVSKLQYEQYLSEVMSFKAQIQENEAEIETAKINISYCNIHAPTDAVTGKLQINVGNLIRNAGEEPLVLLNKITPAYGYFSVPQKDLPRIMELHRKKPLKVKAFLTQTVYEGELDLIDNQVDDQTGSIWLRGIFPNEEKMLWPGEFIDIRLMLEEKNNAVLIPTKAIAYGQKGKYVFLLQEDNTVKLSWIQAGQVFDNMTLIEKGVCPGDTVVTSGQINLNDGAKVSVRRIEPREHL